MASDSGATVHCSGVNFPDTQAASGDANTLDDYEEGEYEITVVGSTSGNFVLSGTEETIAYTKIGRLVHVQGAIQIDSDNSASGNIRFSLPFTAANISHLSGRAYGTAFLLNAGSTLAGKIVTHAGEGNAFFTLVHISDDGTTYPHLTHAEVDGNWFVGFSLHYIAA